MPAKQTLLRDTTDPPCPACARFAGDNLDRKFNVPQADGDTVPPGPGRPTSPVASWLNRSTRAKRHSFSAVSNPLRPRYEAPLLFILFSFRLADVARAASAVAAWTGGSARHTLRWFSKMLCAKLLNTHPRLSIGGPSLCVFWSPGQESSCNLLQCGFVAISSSCRVCQDRLPRRQIGSGRLLPSRQVFLAWSG